MKFELIRKKIEHIAETFGYDMGQFFILAIYNTLSDLPEVTNEEIKFKYDGLRKINKMINKTPQLEKMKEVLDFKQ